MENRKRKRGTEIDSNLLDQITGKWMAYSEIQELESANKVKFKRGKFSNQEDECILRVVNEFLTENDISHDALVQSIVERDRAKRKGCLTKDLYVRVARALKYRPVMFVYRRIRSLLHPGNNAGYFTPEEDIQLMDLVKQYGPQWEVISKHLGRMNLACRDRYRIIRSKFPDESSVLDPLRRTRRKWTDEETKKMLNVIEQIKKDYNVDHPVNWEKIAQQMENRSEADCKTRWFQYLKVRTEGDLPKWNVKDSLELCQTIWDLGIDHQSEIEWTKLNPKWPGCKLSAEWEKLKKRIPNSDNMHIDDILTGLIELLKQQVKRDFISDEEDEYEESVEEVKQKRTLEVEETVEEIEEVEREATEEQLTIEEKVAIESEENGTDANEEQLVTIISLEQPQQSEQSKDDRKKRKEEKRKRKEEKKRSREEKKKAKKEKKSRKKSRKNEL